MNYKLLISFLLTLALLAGCTTGATPAASAIPPSPRPASVTPGPTSTPEPPTITPSHTPYDSSRLPTAGPTHTASATLPPSATPTITPTTRPSISSQGPYLVYLVEEVRGEYSLVLLEKDGSRRSLLPCRRTQPSPISEMPSHPMANGWPFTLAESIAPPMTWRST